MVLGIDVGERAGYFLSDKEGEFGSFSYTKKKPSIYLQFKTKKEKNKTKKVKIMKKRKKASMLRFYDDIEELFIFLGNKFDIVVVGKPTDRYETIASHFEYIAIIRLLCEKYNKKFCIVIDSTCKSEIIGHGHAEKEDIIMWSGIENEHIADAKMFVRYVEKKLKQYKDFLS